MFRVILEEKDGTAFLLCNSIIDCQEYYHSKDSRTINGATVYANNYAESNIRKWLNETFYETAFTSLQQGLIQITELDNSAKSTNPYNSPTRWDGGTNQYVCENTSDKIFLLSEADATNSNYGFTSEQTDDTAKYRKPSDYAQSQGCYMSTSSEYLGNGGWWLRSPRCNTSVQARNVNTLGECDGTEFVTNAQLGVVPALKITL